MVPVCIYGVPFLFYLVAYNGIRIVVVAVAVANALGVDSKKENAYGLVLSSQVCPVIMEKWDALVLTNLPFANK